MSDTGATIQLVSGSAETSATGACHPSRELCHPSTVMEPEDDDHVDLEE